MTKNSQWWLSSDNSEKVDLGDMSDNNMKARKDHVDGNKHFPGKNGCYMSSSLGGMLISVGRLVLSETIDSTT